MKELLLDANVLVRFLVQDDASQSPAATALLESADRQECRLHLDGLAIAESVYVLVGHYRRNRKDVVGALLTLIQSSGVVTADADVVIVGAVAGVVELEHLPEDFADLLQQDLTVLVGC